MAAIGIDLGRNVAAVRVERQGGKYVCTWAEAWAYDDIEGANPWCIESAALWMERLISKEFGPRQEWADATDVVIEELWLTKGKYIDPTDLFPMVAQQAILHTDAFQWYDIHEVDPKEVSLKTGLTKGHRVSMAHLYVEGLCSVSEYSGEIEPFGKFKGPQGGCGDHTLAPHVADAVTLAYYVESRKALEERVQESECQKRLRDAEAAEAADGPKILRSDVDGGAFWIGTQDGPERPATENDCKGEE